MCVILSSEVVKPIYFKGANSKLNRSYFKLNTTKTRNSLRVDTKIRGPLGQDPLDYTCIDVKALIRPVVWVKGVYFSELNDL